MELFNNPVGSTGSPTGMLPEPVEGAEIEVIEQVQ
jgi:hypothetical protein